MIIMFSGVHCTNCRMVKPRFLKMAEGKDAIVFDEPDQGMIDRYKLKSLPTFIKFSDGEEVMRKTGVLSNKELEELFEGE